MKVKMIVPQFWAESRLQQKANGKQITVHRFGWSDTSQAYAQANADRRVQEALQRILSGEKLARRDPKTAYNGAEGVPIREEIISRHGTSVITRNSYGARCLNSPEVLFADIDYSDSPSLWFSLSILLCVLTLAGFSSFLLHSKMILLIALALAIPVSLGVNSLLYRTRLWLSGGHQQIAKNRILHFLKNYPDWNLRLYRTPAGLRVMVTHRTFSSDEPVVHEFFKAIGTDPIYITMCLRQCCFRARLTAKPWRIGINDHLRPRPGVWPIAEKHLPTRNQWVDQYEAKARSYSAAAFLETLGNGLISPPVEPIQKLHDTLCAAHQELPLA